MWARSAPGLAVWSRASGGQDASFEACTSRTPRAGIARLSVRLTESVLAQRCGCGRFIRQSDANLTPRRRAKIFLELRECGAEPRESLSPRARPRRRSLRTG